MTALFEWAVVIIEPLAIAVLLLGLLKFAWSFAPSEMMGRDGRRRSHRLNPGLLTLGRHILSGLAVLIVADLICNMLHLNAETMLLLGELVAIRSLTSFFLERELTHLKEDEASRGAAGPADSGFPAPGAGQDGEAQAGIGGPGLAFGPLPGATGLRRGPRAVRPG